MVFSDTSTFQGLVQDIDFLLFGSSAVQNTDYSLADRVRNINTTWDEAIVELYKADPNNKFDDTTNTDFPLATLPLVAGQDHYALLDSALVIHGVRIMDQNGAFKTLTPVLKSQLGDSELNATGTPDKYYKMGGAVFPVPIPNYGYAGGVELEFQRGGNHFTAASTTASPGFNPQFHRFLSLGAALDYAIANGMQKKISNLGAQKEAMRLKMIEHYQRRSPDLKPKFSLRTGNTGRFGL